MVACEQAIEIILKAVAPLPPTNLPLEQCDGLTLASAVPPAGPAILSPGTRLTPFHLASVGGVRTLTVHPPPHVSLTLDAAVDESLRAAIRRSGADIRPSARTMPAPPKGPRRKGSLPTAKAIGRELMADMRRSHLMVLARGVLDASSPDGDLAHRLNAEGGVLFFEGVAADPSSQVTAGIFPKPRVPVAPEVAGPKYFFSIPADPAGALVGWVMFGTVIVNRLMGRPAEKCRPPVVLAMSDGPLAATGGRTMLVPAILRPDEKFTGWRVSPLAPFAGGSADAAALARANGLIVRPPGAGPLAARAVCEVVPLEPMLG